MVSLNQLFYFLEDTRELSNHSLVLFIAHPHQIFWLDDQLLINGHHSFYKMISKNKAYAMQDLSCVSAIERVTRVRFDHSYFPSPVNSHYGSDLPVTRDVVDEGHINIMWLGRLDYDKVHSLVNLLDNLMDISCSGATVHIIGDGNSLSLIDLNKYTPKITIVFNSIMFSEERNRYIRENADLVVAMGISSLDASIEGIPTFLPLVSREKFRDDRFTLISEAPGYSLGFEKEDCLLNKVKTYTLSEALDLVYKQKKKIELGKQCQDYVLEKFSVSHNVEEILKIITGTKLTKKKVCHNPIVLQQLIIYSLYRFFRKNNCEYNDYVLYHSKLRNLYKKDKKALIRTVLHDMLKRDKR